LTEGMITLPVQCTELFEPFFDLKIKNCQIMKGEEAGRGGLNMTSFKIEASFGFGSFKCISVTITGFFKCLNSL